MCQRPSGDLALLCIKKQLEGLWQTTEFLIRILSRNCKDTKEALKPTMKVEKHSSAALRDPIVLSEQLEEKLCEKIDQVISYTHRAVEKSKGCLITVDKPQKKQVANSATRNLRQSGNRLEIEKVSESTQKSKCSERTREFAGQSRAEFLKTTYGSAFAKPKRHSTDKATKFTRVCAANRHRKSIESSVNSNENVLDNPFIFKDIDDLVRRAVNCSTNGETSVGIDSVPDTNYKVEFVRTPINLEEAIKTGLIEPHNEFIQYVSSYQRDLNCLTRPKNNCGNSHQSKFLQELAKRNQLCTASCEDSYVELRKCFSIMEKCHIFPAVDTDISNCSENLSNYRKSVLLLKYNDHQKWVDLETKKLESFFKKQHLQLLKTFESDIKKFISIENKAILLKTLSSLTNIVPYGNLI